jgi:hypothetical protein
MNRRIEDLKRERENDRMELLENWDDPQAHNMFHGKWDRYHHNYEDAVMDRMCPTTQFTTYNNVPTLQIDA